MLDILNRRKPAAPTVDDELSDQLADMLEGRIAAEDPASPHFNPASGLDEPESADILGLVGTRLAKALEYHRGEVNRLATETDAIRRRADDAIASREILRRQHEDALDIWSAAEERRKHVAAAPEGETSGQPVAASEAAE
ncbi:MAG: hypothetical protein BGN87_00305 [Rhizobiales bacterium 65-79]|nr:hypothetical protein [Hyphomicrobiales bacterium]OJU02625.1 MAG: hypothetical protein BGN87_00305 [Rhizobiales bacterium 65-79]